MLTRLFVKNFALIKELNLEFKDGLTVITGETGAGKSIMLNALGLILGNRADTDAIGNPEQGCIVEASFALSDKLKGIFDEHDLIFDRECIIRRELLPNGKSRAFVNDSLSTNKVLKELGEHLIDIHGQRDNQLLFKPEYRIQILDALAKNDELLKLYQAQYRLLKQKEVQLKALEQNQHQGKQEQAFKQFQLDELTKAQLSDADEIALLEEKQERFDKNEDIKQLCEYVLSLNEDPLNFQGQIAAVRRKSEALQSISSFEQMAKTALEIEEQFKDMQAQASDILESADFDAEEKLLNEQRLDLLNQLLSKYGYAELKDLIAFQTALDQELQDLDFSDEKLDLLTKEIASVKADLSKKASELHERRQAAAKILEKEISNTLPQLNMESAKVGFHLNMLEDFNKLGCSDVLLHARLNKGSKDSDILKIASGGELSRLMLALKSAMCKHLDLPTVIFDEIDTGLGGETASKMGQVLAGMAANMQLLSITHLAQIAAKGSQHYKVIKQEDGDKTYSRISVLSADERLQEVARMISGERISPEALANAQVLLN